MSDFVGLYDGKSSFWMNISNYSCVFIYINSKFNTIKIFAVSVFSLICVFVIPFCSGFLPPFQYIFHPRLRENDGSCCVSGCRWGFAKVSGCLLWQPLRQPETLKPHHNSRSIGSHDKNLLRARLNRLACGSVVEGGCSGWSGSCHCTLPLSLRVTR